MCHIFVGRQKNIGQHVWIPAVLSSGNAAVWLVSVLFTTDRMQSIKPALLSPMFCGLSVCWSRLWALQKRMNWLKCCLGVSGLKPAKHRAYITWGSYWRHLVSTIGWWCAVAMWTYVKLLWQLAIFCVHIWCVGLPLHTSFLLIGLMHCELNTKFWSRSSIFLCRRPTPVFIATCTYSSLPARFKSWFL